MKKQYIARKIPRKKDVAAAGKGRFEGQSFPIVGVGASAGGLEAFSQLLRYLPVDSGMAFVLVQHLDPDHESALTEILARAAAMPVREAKDKVVVQTNHVYVIPPDKRLTVERGRLRLEPRGQTTGAQHSIALAYQEFCEHRG
jgi:two-component system, chemotaxis family, CheB/CheR fusion protein